MGRGGWQRRHTLPFLTQTSSHPTRQAFHKDPKGLAPHGHAEALARPGLPGFFNPYVTALLEGHLIKEAPAGTNGKLRGVLNIAPLSTKIVDSQGAGAGGLSQVSPQATQKELETRASPWPSGATGGERKDPP